MDNKQMLSSKFFHLCYKGENLQADNNAVTIIVIVTGERYVIVLNFWLIGKIILFCVSGVSIGWT